MTIFCRLALLVAVALFCFAALLGGSSSPVDLSLIKAARGIATNHSMVESAAITLTHVGSGMVLIPMALMAAGWLGWKSRFRDAALVLLISIGGRLLIEGMKVAIGRPRPELDPYPVYVSSLSFPSGHAGNSMLTFLALALLLPRESRPALVALAVVVSVAIGLTRPMLGVHWPSDIVGGWSFGIAWTILCLAMVRRDRTAA